MDPDIKVNTLRDLWQHADQQHWIPIQGISMLPLLHEGDRVLVSHNISNVRFGDILVFQKQERLVAHRVVRIIKKPGQTNIFLTKGDYCSYFDGFLSEPEVLGRVTNIRKNEREYDQSTPGWRLLNSFLAACHLLLGNIIKTIRQIKHSFQK